VDLNLRVEEEGGERTGLREGCSDGGEKKELMIRAGGSCYRCCTGGLDGERQFLFRVGVRGGEVSCGCKIKRDFREGSIARHDGVPP